MANTNEAEGICSTFCVLAVPSTQSSTICCFLRRRRKGKRGSFCDVMRSLTYDRPRLLLFNQIQVYRLIIEIVEIEKARVTVDFTLTILV